ncbi:uncharacterized protein [Phaseolus vulgaris]|uniref:uncharacterized protein n=1 Tax=Phaseolus vulgaris TaxID=3885 RepID=UPI0035C95A72
MVVEDLDEAIARERLGFNFGTLLAQSNALIITKARVQEQVALRVQEQVALVEARAKEEMALAGEKKKEEMTLLAQTFATRKIALNRELASLRHAETDLSKRLHDKGQEAVELQANILPLRMEKIKLEEEAEAMKARMARLEERATDQEVQLCRREAELTEQAAKFKEIEAELTEDVADAFASGFEDALEQVACAHPEIDLSLFSMSKQVVEVQIVPRSPPS